MGPTNPLDQKQTCLCSKVQSRTLRDSSSSGDLKTDFPAGIGGETESTSYEKRHRQPVHRIAMDRHAAVSEPSARWPCLKKWLGQEIVISISLCALGINGVNADAASGANATATAPVVPSGPDVPAYVSDE